MPADLDAPSSRLFQGFVDTVTGGFAAGWAAEPGNADPVEIELLIDGVAVGRGMADGYRSDLEEAGFGQGRHAFRIAIPAVFQDGQLHAVAIRLDTETLLLPLEPEQVLGHPPPPGPAAALASPTIARAVDLSVIMPTYNRGVVMEASVEAYARCAKRLGAELVVIDDGSRDDTPDRLLRLSASHPNLVTDRVSNGGPARARNLAASMARGKVLVFVADDVLPVDNDMLAIHAAAHTKFRDVGQAVLGKISWPNVSDLPVNFVMSHIQSEGGQQFSTRGMIAHRWYDWRLFHSCNVSVKKALVSDWLTDGYDSSFYLGAIDGPEFALRRTLALQERGEALGVFYAPSAHLVHHHPYTVAGFLSRQTSVGIMAQRFLELHPGRAHDLGLHELQDRLAMPLDESNLPIEHYFSVFEGLKSWALVIENHYGLGQQNWHGDLLRTVFQLAFFEGFLRMQSSAQVNLAAGCRYVLEDVRHRMNRAIASEALGDLPGFGLV